MVFNIYLIGDFMELLQIIILSLVQGITEILPISSSGHLLIIKKILNLQTDGLLLEILLHFGSLIGIILFYRKELMLIMKDSFLFLFNKEKINSKRNFHLLICLFFSTLTTSIFGLLFLDIIERYFTNLNIIPYFFVISALILLFTKFENNHKELNDITFKDSILIGLVQILGLFPGISRSSTTLFGSKLAKLNNSSAFNYSFLLFIPISFGSFILELVKLSINKEAINIPLSNILIAIILTCITTYYSIKLLNKIIKKDKLYYFSYYLLILAFFCIMFIK